MSEILRTRAAEVQALLDHDPANPCPPLLAKDFEALRQSIEEHGYLDAWPVVVSAGPACEGEIIDGFHRTKICAELGIEPAVVTVPCPDEAEFLILQVRANLARRQLTEVDRYRLGVKLETAYANRHGGNRTKQAGQLTALPAGDTRDLVAKEVGLTGKTYERIAKVMSSTDETLKAGLEDGTLSAYGAFKQLRDKEAQADLDAAVDRQREAEAELDEHFITSPEDQEETAAAERSRLVAEAVRRTMELDQLVTKNRLMDQDVLDYRSRPHTAAGAARRLAEWLDLVATALELNR